MTRRMMVAQGIALLAVLAIVVPTEIQHLRDAQQRHWSDWFIGVDTSTTLLLPLLASLPYFWLIRRPFGTFSGTWWTRLRQWWGSREAGRLTIVAGALIALTSLWMSSSVASIPVDDQGRDRFGDLPPAYHDEFSYLFQAKTYLAGRLSFPSHPTAARLFDQMHVVNEGRFASRYFPATGLFIAPWLWLGWPILGHWLAGAATCWLVFGIGRELSNNGTGLLAGLLTAVSPGLALFGNLLLAHHPTMLGLFFFAWSILKWQRRGSVRDAASAGLGLSWAMLCRPMTAAGFALPFGVLFLWKNLAAWRSADVSSERSARRRSATLAIVAMAIPLLIGFVVLGIHNRAITGSVWSSPYQLFNDVYTPRHVYGFNNVVRGEQHLGPRVLENYDRWAVNLTPMLAVENTFVRLLACWQWTVGLMPLLVAVTIFVVGSSPSDRRWWLIFTSAVSLFVAHIPYWFTGIMDWHYVFESGPLWCLLLAAVTDRLVRSWLADDRARMPTWWFAFVSMAVVVNLTDLPPLWYPSKLEAGVNQVAYSRRKYREFERLLDQTVTQRPALVLIEPDPADRHIDYVDNDPPLTADVLRARWPVTEWTLDRVVAEFPDRTIYLAQIKTGTVQRVSLQGR